MLAAALLGVALIVWLQGALVGLQWAAPGESDCVPLDRERVLAPAAILIALPLTLAGLWVIRIAYRVAQASQWPYPGVRLLRPVRVWRGRQAQVFAWVNGLLGLSLALAGPALGWSLFRVVDLLLGDALILCLGAG
jgi:hypothetical protein